MAKQKDENRKNNQIRKEAGYQREDNDQLQI